MGLTALQCRFHLAPTESEREPPSPPLHAQAHGAPLTRQMRIDGKVVGADAKTGEAEDRGLPEAAEGRDADAAGACARVSDKSIAAVSQK